MAWTFEITTGNWYDPSGHYVSTGYAGNGLGKNNPAAEGEANVGPIPEGRYLMGPWFDDPGGKGPLVCHLYPMPGTDTHGRSGFMIHGDSVKHPGTASHGCAIADHDTRLLMSHGSDLELDVIVGSLVEA